MVIENRFSIGRNSPLFWALLASVLLHAGFFLTSEPDEQIMQVHNSQPLALKLGTPLPQPKVMSTPTARVIDELILTAAADAPKISKQKEEQKPAEVIQKPKGETEELIVTKEVKLRAKPITPIYPEAARRKKQQGLVMVRAQVDPLGKTHAVKVAQSSGFPLLDQAALDAVIQWSFLPAQHNGKTIAAWIEVPIDFKLR